MATFPGLVEHFFQFPKRSSTFVTWVSECAIAYKVDAICQLGVVLNVSVNTFDFAQ